MTGLPDGWESDYDGQRWFYKYKPTGHVQYHFPTEGDEFPDFIAAGAPALPLAPEERLESQQQVRRLVGIAPNGAASSNAPKSRMSATARPISDAWNDEPGDADVFQPESFMFLGPGAYTDVSPLVEEEVEAAAAEEEAAKRAVVGKSEQELKPDKGVSPVASERPTPKVANSEPAILQEEAAKDTDVEEPQVTPPPQAQDLPIHMIDGRELPYELAVESPRQFNPVGQMAELATEQTASAYIELHPDPVEIGDNTILAPIETAAPTGIAELPEKSSPIERKKEELKIVPPQKKADNREIVEQKVQREPEALVSKNEEEKKREGYKPYDPSQAEPISSGGMASPSTAEPGRGTSLQRETSLLINAGSGSPPNKSSNDIPAVLSPASQEPAFAEFKGPEGRRSIERGAETPNGTESPRSSISLTSTPSVLKPGRIPQNRQVETPPTPEAQPGVTKFPSVLKPARGRAASQPGIPAPSTASPASSPQHDQGPVVLPPVAAQPVLRSMSAVPALREAALPAPVQRPASTQPVSGGRAPGPAQQMPYHPQARMHTPPVNNLYSIVSPVPSPSPAPSHWQVSRRHSSFSPSDVSPLQSRSGSQSSGMPIFTPSPASQAQPSSMVQSPEPLSHGTPGSAGPPVPKKIPLPPVQGSYFPAQDGAAQGGEPSRRHSLPPQPLAQMMQKGPAGVGVTSPGPPTRAQSSQQPSVPMQSSPVHNTPEKPLTRIEEHEEHGSAHQTPPTASAVLATAHTPITQAHIQSGQPASQPVVYQQAAPPPDPRFQQQWRPPVAGTMPHMQHLQQNSAPRPPGAIPHQQPAQMAPPGHMFIQGQAIQPGFAPPPGAQPMIQPLGQMANHPQGFTPTTQPLAPLSPNTMSPQSAPSSSANPMSPLAKAKDNKWTKWFKGSKSPQISAPMPAQYVPPALAPVVIPRPDLQGRQGAGWSAGAPQPGWQQGSPAPIQPGVYPPAPASHPHYQYQGGQPNPGAPFVPAGPRDAAPPPLVTQNPQTSPTGSQVNRIPRKPPGQGAVPGQQTSPSSPTPLVSAGQPPAHPTGPATTGQPLQQREQSKLRKQPPGDVHGLENKLVPAPLFSGQNAAPAGQVAQGSTGAVGQGGINRTTTRDKWAKNPASDYSGGDWGHTDWK
ncbi:hypothetical protein B0I35DRAFT_239669 [Stachybotrys elegans]|uniref:WW domain-containing protein n=1 Tax=Stachybotrys elegans TaxID=80388 RepID=A0A8K0WQN3_9HYPO|nr:hypothetical protein B0I35DRAFT_239669 [Stachybotrys elegans]